MLKVAGVNLNISGSQTYEYNKCQVHGTFAVSRKLFSDNKRYFKMVSLT